MVQALIKTLFAAALLALPCGRAAAQNAAASADTLTIDDALRLALQNNSALLSAEQDVIVAEQRVKEASFLFYPQPGLAGTITKSNLKYPMVLSPEMGSQYIGPSDYENFYTVKAVLTQTVYAGGRNKNTYRLAKAALKQAKTRYEAIRREAVLTLQNSFYRTMFAKKHYEACFSWLASMRKTVAQARFGDLEDIEARALVSRMESDSSLAEQEVKLERIGLLRAINRELDRSVDVTGDFKPSMTGIDLAKATAWAMELRPELKSEIYKAEMDAIAVNLAMSRRSPTVMLGGSYNVVGNKFPLPQNSWETTLAIQLPIAYDFWTQITQRKAEQRQGDLKRAALQDKVRLEVRQAYENLWFWQKEVPLRFDAWSQLESRYSASRLQASLAGLRAARAVYDTYVNYIESVREQLLARAQLEWALGHELAAE